MNVQDEQIIIPCSKTMDFIKISDIIRCEGLQNYTRIFLKEGKKIVSSSNIGIYKDCLQRYGFFTCHKSHIINSELINRYHKDGQVEMIDNSLVPVSRRKKHEFFEKVIKGKNVMLQTF